MDRIQQVHDCNVQYSVPCTRYSVVYSAQCSLHTVLSTYSIHRTCTHVHTCAHTCAHMRTHVHTCAHKCAHTCAHTCTHTCTHMCTHLCTHMRTHVHTHAYTCAHVHMYTCTHMCTHTAYTAHCIIQSVTYGLWQSVLIKRLKPEINVQLSQNQDNDSWTKTTWMLY